MAMMSDHVAPTPDVNATYPVPFYDPFTALAWLAGLTSALELGTAVTVLPYRSPLLTARVVANIDQFSGGRFILGVGAGWSKPEFDALGLPFDRRGPMADEYLDAIKMFWTNDLVSKNGEYLAFRTELPIGARRPQRGLRSAGSGPPPGRRAAAGPGRRRA